MYSNGDGAPNSKRPFGQAQGKPFEASHYKLNTYSQCPRKYYFEYLDEKIAPMKRFLKQPKPELEIGNIVHVSLCDYFKEPVPNRNFQTLKKILTYAWQPPQQKRFGFTSIEEERDWYVQALQMLKTFVQYQNESEQLFYIPDPHSREELIKIPLDDGLILQGKVDRIDELKDGSLHVIDYKTGRKQEDDDFQVFTYVILAKQKFGKQIKKASYFYLRTGYWKTYTPSDGDEQVTIRRIKQIVKTIQEDKVWAPKISKLCAYCDYREYCPARKEVDEFLGVKRAQEEEFEVAKDLPF